MSDNPCPCTGIAFPRLVFNAPSLSSIAYRWGEYDDFRSALLQPLSGEMELTTPDGAQIWRPTPDSGDLALQIAEWWAYLADILTLYTERAANQVYLRTADLPESLGRLVPLLGYRPRPAIGARVTLAGLVRGPRPVSLQQGLQVQSKPGPGQPPQVFELDAAAVLQPLAPVATQPQTTQMPALATGQTTGQVLLAGKPGNLKVGDEVLLLSSAWNGTDSTYAICSVTAIAPAPGGTQVSFDIAVPGGGTGTAGATNWQLLKAQSSTTLYPYLPNPPYPYSQSATARRFVNAQRSLPIGSVDSTRVVGLSAGVMGSTVHLSSIVRSIAPGDFILIENPTSPSKTAVPGFVTAVGEVIWNANNPTSPTTWPPPGSPPDTTEPAVPIPHSVVSFNTLATISGDPSTFIMRYGYADVGKLIDVPVSGALQTGTVTVDPGSLNANPTGLATSTLEPGDPLLVSDANGDGATATLGDNGVVTLDPSAPALVAPLQVFSNLLAFSRGKSVAPEVLGDGNPAIAGQDFTLKNAPVTYLADQPGRSDEGYSSTVRLWVDNVEWTEVPSFFQQGPRAQVFVTREDDQGKTHVLGGDGIDGARFPSGTGNIVASYRVGAGAARPPPTSVSVLLQPQPGLQALVNPVPPIGGADADSPADLRRLAPLSVLTFGRAVSVDDYAAIAAATPGVARVNAAYAFDPVQQRPVVTLWVGDDAGAVTAARAAISPVSDPNRPVVINPADPVQLSLSLTYVRDPRYQDPIVQVAVRAALIDPATGLFGSNVVQIGQAFYDSEIYAACLAVPGVHAVHSLSVTVGAPRFIRYFWQSPLFVRRPVRLPDANGAVPAPCSGHRYTPGPDGFFVLADTALQLSGSLGP